jgi:plasmid maintenance system antidote protein VapI
MPYNSQDKYEMSLRQARVDIGQGIGNALTNATNFVNKLYEGKEITEDDKLEKIFEITKKMFLNSQSEIEIQYQDWFEKNDRTLRLSTGLEVPVIENGEEI